MVSSEFLFLNAASWISCCGERGLLSMAFAPDYATSRRFYIYYTDLAGSIRVDEVLRDANNPNIADPSTRRQVIVIPHPGQSNHNGGQLQFGPDGMLYIGTGDGGGGGDPFRTGQNLGDRRGKILRIDPRENEAQELPYTIPANNPFTTRDAAWGEIWSFGVRNPWRFSFDRLTGAFVLGDVGQNAVGGDRLAADRRGVGARGQLRLELHGGAAPLQQQLSRAGESHPADLRVLARNGRCSITGGYVARDPNIVSMDGRYLYVDLCSGPIRSNVPGIPDATDDRSEDVSVSFPTSFGEDACGHLYVMGQGSGDNVFRINSTDPPLGTCPDAFPLPTLTGTVDDNAQIHMYDPNGD